VGDAEGEREGKVGEVHGRKRAEPDGGGDSVPHPGRVGDSQGQQCEVPRKRGAIVGRSGETGGSGSWSDYDIILCGDNKHRRIPKGSLESCVQSLADGLPDGVAGGGLPCGHQYPLAPAYQGRVGLLRGIGNAIAPAVAAVFIRAFLESADDL
jgi:DNA (cytosine-5)-methyltransferase 1